jgi:ribosomal protein S18 acetylase RimI-like enzyme
MPARQPGLPADEGRTGVTGSGAVLIRALTPADADDIEHLYGQSAEHLRALGDDTDFRFTVEFYRRDGFGANPAFAGVGAVLGGRLVGYLLYSFGYDTDRAIRYLFIIDLLVDRDVRRQGVGRALMRRAAEICREGGGSELFWAVYRENELALRFYERLGASEVRDLRFMRLQI